MERSISLGGWGEVYRGLDLRSGRPVAIKRALPIDPNGKNTEEEATFAYRRFLEEVKVLQTLDFAGIPKCLSSFSMPESRHCLVMEFIEGVDLDRQVQDHLKLAGGLPPAAMAVDYCIQACKILEYLHNLTPHPIVHRDVKPSNLILRHLDNRIYLVDFGFARRIGPSLGTKTMVGTIGYAPIEQCQGNPSPLSDLYAVGATLHYLLTGKQPTPFDIEPLDLTRPELPPTLVRAVMTATRNEKSQRYNSVYSFRRELERILPDLRLFETQEFVVSDYNLTPAPPTEEVPVAPPAELPPPAEAPLPSVSGQDPPRAGTIPLADRPYFQLPRAATLSRKAAINVAQRVSQMLLVLVLVLAGWMLWNRHDQKKQLILASEILPGWQARAASGLQPGPLPSIILQPNSSDEPIQSRLLQSGPSGFILARAEDPPASLLSLELATADPATIWLLIGLEGEQNYRIYRIVTLAKSTARPTDLDCNIYHEGSRSLAANTLLPPASESGYLLPREGDEIVHSKALHIDIKPANVSRLGVVLQSCPSAVVVRLSEAR